MCSGDDIKSVVSDTWSTDVIASDSEPPEQNQLERLEEVVEEPAANLLGVHEVSCNVPGSCKNQCIFVTSFIWVLEVKLVLLIVVQYLLSYEI